MKHLVILMAAVLAFSTAKADVKLARIFNSHMVLQQGQENPLWGWADKNEKITILFAGQSMETTAKKDGSWEVKLPELDYGGPYTLIVEGKNSLKLTDIWIGEVWVCSGQSNMEWVVENVKNAGQEIAEADYPNIRMFTVPKNIGVEPQNDIIGGSWEQCNPENVPHFSAVGYFFARKLYQELNVPIGMIHTSWGGTVVETWMSPKMIKEQGDFDAELKELQKFDLKKYKEKRRKEAEAILGERLPSKDEGLVDGVAVYAAPDLDDASWATIKTPALWEAEGYPDMDGVAWYRTTITLSKAQAGQEASLSLGPVDDTDQTWVNGQLVGKGEMYTDFRDYPLKAGILHEGENTIAVRVVDTGGGGGLYAQDADVFLQTGDEKLSLAGDWKFKITELNQSMLNLTPNDYPTLLYHGMLKPLVPYGIKGAIWYQGESNADRAYQYRELFQDLIKDWRAQWGQGDFPFLWVQLANFMAPDEQPAESAWAELREAQTRALELPATGMASAIDIGEAGDIHPRNKQDVGKRLALNALKVAYDEDVVNMGPLYDRMETKGSKVLIHFKDTGSGLTVKSKYGYVNAFAIAGADQHFYWAQARIVGDNTVEVWADEVAAPVAVRFGWGNNPDDFNLYNKAGLPANPFRTDDWKGVTE